MKSVLISIQPKWCELIANGKKTIEVRKTRPKIDVPFKCYIYCTEGDALATPCLNIPKYTIHRMNNGTVEGRKMTQQERKQSDHTYANGKVIGEFVCDKIIQYECSSDGFGELATTCGTCLTYDEIINYCNGYDLFGWKITDLVIYDKPKELFEFANYNKYQVCKEKGCFSDNCWICPNNAILTRPPQSWCYVEELGA